jgi:hypothetical protein
MDNTPTISVTLSADLLTHLRCRAQSEQVPLSWLVAGMVCDTIVARKERPGRIRGAHVPRLGRLQRSPT